MLLIRRVAFFSLATFFAFFIHHPILVTQPNNPYSGLRIDANDPRYALVPILYSRRATGHAFKPNGVWAWFLEAFIIVSFC